MSTLHRTGRRFRRGVRTRMLTLATLVVVPLLLAAVVRAFDRRTAEAERVGVRARELAAVVARSLDARASDAHTLLVGLRELLDPAAPVTLNDLRLRRLYAGMPLAYANLWIASAEGSILAAARIGTVGRDTMSVAGRRYFERTLESKAFTIGEIVPARGLAGKPLILPFALPVLDSVTGRVRGVVGASALVDSLDALRLARSLPDGSVLTIVDRDERVVYRSRDNARWAGRLLGDITGLYHQPIVDSGGATVDVRRAADGAERVIGFAPMPSTGWMIYVGIPASIALAAANVQFQRDLAISAVTALVLLSLVVLITLRAVRPIESLTADALALTAGDESRRSTIIQDDEIGDLARAFNTMADAAEQRRHALLDSEARYRLLFDANPLPLLAWSPTTGRLTSVNDAAAAHFGATRRQLTQQPVASLLHPDDAHRFAEQLQAVPAGPTHCGVWRLLHTDGRTMDMELVMAPYRHADGDQVITVAIDTTARRAAERALEESREQLRQSQKMEALGSFAGGIAHDFNNYLSAIIGYGELLESQMATDDPSRRDVAEVLTAAARAADLTRQILVFSRKQVVEPQLLDPADVVRGVERMLERLMREDIRITSRHDAAGQTVRIDRGHLEQVLVNLAANARDAMPAGGTFSITTSAIEVTAGSSGVHAGLEPGRFVMITVRDSGTGIPAEVRERIFEPFFTTKERGRGTGLGLALVYSIVQQAGGAIRVDSAPDAGTTVALYLPAADAPTALPLTASHSTERPIGRERILLVEDDEAVRAVTHQMLMRHGYDVVLATDGLDGLAKVHTSESPFALVVTDVVMPGMRGRELAQHIRALHPEQPVLFVSGYADDATLIDEVHDERSGFLAKPFTTTELLQKVREALDAAAGTTVA